MRLCDDCPHLIESWDEVSDADGRTYAIPWPIPPDGHDSTEQTR